MSKNIQVSLKSSPVGCMHLSFTAVYQLFGNVVLLQGYLLFELF